MKYIPRDGITLLKIQGVYMLAATAEIRKDCRYIREINSTGAYIWEKLTEGMNEEAIAQDIKENFQIDPEVDVRSDVRTYIGALHEAGYLISEGEQDE